MNIKKISKDKIIEVLRKIYDPEIPINIIDLGLIYEIRIKNNNIYIKMTLTTVGCPLWRLIVKQVENIVKSIEGVKDVKVDLVWDPPWTLDRISPEVRKELGLD